MKNLINTAKAAIIVAVFALSACGDVGLLLPVENGEPEVRVLSVPKGAILMSEDTFEVSIDYDDEEFFPDRMIIDLRDLSGEVLFSVELDQEGIYELPLPVALPAYLEPGSYEVGVTVFQAEEKIADNNSLFFFVSEEYRIRAITAYPQIFYPGGRGLVIADLDIPENSNPYLRWSSEDTEIYAGTLNEGADRLQLEVPDREGIYTIELEIFPFEPGQVLGADTENESGNGEQKPGFDFVSDISLEAQFFVSAAQDIDDAELGPEKDYYSLFHFRGESVDWGYNSNGSVAAPIGMPVLDITRGIFGFRLDGSTGFTVDDIILPVVDGYIQPFSYSARLVVEALNGSVTKMTDGNGDFVFSIEFSEGVLTAAVLDTVSSITPVIYEGNGADLTLTVLPEPGTIRYLWFVDGVLLGDDEFVYIPQKIAPGGLTVIGGDEGMYGVLDELGVYYKLTNEGPEVDIEVFEKAMERMYGSDLVFAEGFDGPRLPDTIEFTGGEETFMIDGGSLLLPPGASIGISSFPDEFESFIVEIALAKPTGQQEEITGESTEAAPIGLKFVDSASGVALVDLEGDTVTADENGDLSLAFISAGDNVTVMYRDVTYPVEYTEDGLRLVIENRGENGELEIKSVLVFKNRIQS